MSTKAVITPDIAQQKIGKLLEAYPFLESYFTNNGLAIEGAEALTLEAFAELNSGGESSIDPARFPEQTAAYISQMHTFMGLDEETQVREISIFPGRNKKGEPEEFSALNLRPGEILSIVGPTGSGKSRLLADIEWVAQEDTPTGRRISINGETPEAKWRFSSSDKLVAQLSQNMNFVMDLSVEEFLELHAESRLISNREEIIARIITAANDLAGETFTPDTAITSLSGGQSRALMIADTAILSRSPVILIDEIENAGIDRQRALSLLLSEEKIVLMATHDPILALMADRRLVISQGGIVKIIETAAEERLILRELEKLDNKMRSYRQKLRSGLRLDENTNNEIVKTKRQGE